MPINGHGQNMLSSANNGLLSVCVNNATSPSNTAKTSNSNKNGHRSSSSHQTHPHLSNVSTSSSPTSFMHENHSNHSNGPMHMSGGPMSPNSQDEFSNSYDMNSHIKRKELFTQRKQREFIPDNKKDDSYWDRRRRNNEAAKRSREKRRYNDMVLEQRVVELTKENHVLKAQLDAIKDKYNICGENLVSVEQIMATLPTTEQVLSITKRPKFSNGGPSPSDLYPQSPGSPIPTSVIQQSSSGPASVDSSSPPAPPSGASTTATTIVAPIIAPASQIQPSAVVAAAAFAHLNNTYLDTSPQRNAYKYRDNGPIEIDGRHEIYGGPRTNFHNTEHPNSNGNTTNACNGGSSVNARYNQHLSPISRSANTQVDHHRHSAHAITSHQHLHPLQPHFETNDVNKISQSNSTCGGSDTDLTAIDDDSNVLNLSRRRSSDTTNSNNNNNNNNNHSNNNNNNNNNNNSISSNNSNTGNHKSKHGSETPPRGIYASLGSSASTEDDQYSVENQPVSDTNNSLPLKLRHKSHLGDKDAATALLALQHIKQEPNSRLSPPWDGEGSSDERDSGISIGTAEWGIQQRTYPLNDRTEPGQIPLNIRSMTAKTFTIPSSVGINGIGAAIGNLAANLSSVGVMGGLTMGSVLNVNENSSDRDERNHRFGDQKSFRAPVMCHLEINSNTDEGNVKEENVHLKSQIARLESEVASIKNMMILNTNSASATAVQ